MYHCIIKYVVTFVRTLVRAALCVPSFVMQCAWRMPPHIVFLVYSVTLQFSRFNNIWLVASVRQLQSLITDHDCEITLP